MKGNILFVMLCLLAFPVHLSGAGAKQGARPKKTTRQERELFFSFIQRMHERADRTATIPSANAQHPIRSPVIPAKSSMSKVLESASKK